MRKSLFFAVLTLSIAFSTLAQPGANDPTFNPVSGANEIVSTIAIQGDGRIIIGGTFSNFNEIERNNIARLNVDGSLDASFNTGTGANNGVRTTAIQSDGKIIIGGDFSSYNGVDRNDIARLNTDGSLDTSFYSGTGVNGGIFTTAIQSDGKIIIGGFFDYYNGSDRGGIARLNSDGTLDTLFNPGTGVSLNNGVYSTSIQSDGKIIIGGSFTSFNGTDINRIARLNVDGSLDASFNTGFGANGIVWTTAIQSDENIIIGGAFKHYNGIVVNRIARLNVSGSLDPSFSPETGAPDIFVTTAIQSNGKIIIGGKITSYNGTARNNIVRLNIDGSLDSSFDPGEGANDHILSTAIQSDDKIVIGGFFTSYNGITRNRIARVLAYDIGINSLQIEDGISIYPVPFTDEFIIEIEGNHEKLNFDILNTLGQVVLNGNVVEKTRVQTSQLAPGVYFVKIEKEKSIIVKRLIKE